MSPQDQIEKASREHKALMAECRVVQLVIRQPIRKDPPTWLDRCRSHFHKLHEYLREHMFREEEGGFMKAVLELRPTLSGRVEALQQEHVEVRAECEEIERALLADDQITPIQARQLRRRITDLLNRIEKHEMAENHLVQEAFFSDIGTLD